MTKKKICFIAQFPPPVHGLSKAVETLYYSEITDEFELEKIDIKNNKHILRTLWRLAASKADLFYFTISQSKGGNLRDLLILKVLELRKKKCLIHLHGGYYRQLVDNKIAPWQRKANYNVLSKIAGAIVLGPSLRYIFKDMVPEDKIFVVPNCVEETFIPDDDTFESIVHARSKEKLMHVLYLSNFLRDKGYPEVLEMAKIEKQHYETSGERRMHFDFAGLFFSDSEKQFFDNYISSHQLEPFITYHGSAYGEKKKELLEKCSIFVLLSKNEGQPISILEAMANGMNVVTTDAGGIPDLVNNQENGLVIPVGEENKAFIAYEYLLNLKDSRMALMNRNVVLNKYKEDIYFNNMSNVFRELLS